MTLDSLRTKPVRFSHLKAYGRSPAHGLHSRISEWKPTKPMLLGTAVHALAFGTKKVIAYEGTRRGKDWEAFKVDHQDAHILSMAENYDARNMADALLKHQEAARVLQGVTETTSSFTWYGRECRSTPDVRGDGYMTDLKTCANADPSHFVWHSARMSYHAQMRMQQMACEQDIDAPAYLVAVESKPPYPVTVFRMTEGALMEGEKLLCLWMERLKSCEESQQWPGYVQSIVPLDIPGDVDLVYGDDEGDE